MKGLSRQLLGSQLAGVGSEARALGVDGALLFPGFEPLDLVVVLGILDPLDDLFLKNKIILRSICNHIVPDNSTLKASLYAS